MRSVLGVVAVGTLITSSAALSQSIEQLDQLELATGSWQAEYFGEFGKGDFGRSNAFELLFGLGDQIAAGIEVEYEHEDGKLSLEEIGVTALLSFADPEESKLGLGVSVGASSDGHRISELELRLIAEKRIEDWWGQGNLIVRRVHEEDGKSSLIAYAWNLSHRFAGPVWFGFEGSGQLMRFADSRGRFDAGHFVGPALTIELEPVDEANGVETKIGLAWFRRVGGEGSRDSARFFVQVTF